jgi:hypothetical protein
LVDWVVSNGGSVNGVTMANFGGSDGGSGWGLVATQVRHGVQETPQALLHALHMLVTTLSSGSCV